MALLKAMHSASQASLKLPTPKFNMPPASATELARTGALTKHIQALNEAERPHKDRIDKLSALNATFVKLMKKHQKV
ncbi:uncharacterized protein SOCE26_048970 [Sorangium cellulosum]|uniref:Uncharacterized protein n=2 Tax=Sorangium cellulosum TaxID=56 RepID=A0A2L0EW08_SORCE|nr:uncharacterized protein SOCE26_048970 [Sorangium cellulosum]